MELFKKLEQGGERVIKKGDSVKKGKGCLNFILY